eukprot:gene5938-9768_t
MSQNLDIIVDTLVRKATDSQLKEEDWGTNIQIIDYLERNPDDMAPLVLQAIVTCMSSKDARTQTLSLSLLDMCVKSSNAELFNRLLSKNLNKVQQLISYNMNLESKFKEYVNDWSKSGVKSTNSTTNQTQTKTQQSKPKTTNFSNKSKYYDSTDKLMKDLQVVEDNVKMLNDIVYAASSPEEILNDDYQQIYINLKEMHLRIIKIIECLPEEKILLKLFTLNDSVDESLLNFENYIKTGMKPTKKDDQSVDNLDDLFKDLHTTSSQNNQKPLIDSSDLFLQDTNTDDDFSSLSHRKDKATAPTVQNETSLDDLFGELSYRKEPEQKQKPVNSLFDFDAVDDTNHNSGDGGLFDFGPTGTTTTTQTNQSKVNEVHDLFDSNPTNSGNNYDEFQQFLESQSQKKNQNDPFE